MSRNPPPETGRNILERESTVASLARATFLVCGPRSVARCRATFSLERRRSSRTFRYGYLVTTSPQSPALPSQTASRKGLAAPASGIADFRGVTGGVYKARERIHRGMLIRDY